MLELFPKIEAATEAICQQWPHSAKVGIVLGTGLNGIADSLGLDVVLPFESIPHFPSSTALGHSGKLHCGSFQGLNILTMQGRTHYYEGAKLADVTLPVRVMKSLGVETLILTNASGGLNPQYAQGDIVVVEDHIDMLPDNPLRGINDDRLGTRFPDMSQPYDFELVDQALAIARNSGFIAHRGVYAAMPGPNYETRGEIRFIRKLGADVVGMSTVPEAIVAAHSGLRTLALSTVTNECKPYVATTTDGEEVVSVAASAEAKVKKIIFGVLEAESQKQ
ncbi:MAG: purine-nucleoside phosphorylase [Planctomycetaceae bacterium]|nr:purine-nucleoside phosphorylase [Planctomycetaceae bacterium]